jgi:alginate O-acetyltransferase complex protein AlgI
VSSSSNVWKAVDSSSAVALPSPTIRVGAGAVPQIADPRIERAHPNIYRFSLLLAQLALLLGVFRVYHVEQFGGPDDLNFFSMCCLMFGAFAIHYWVPFRAKEKFWVAVSMAAAGVFLQRRVILLLFAAGFLFYLVLASGLSYRKRIAIAASTLAAATLFSAKAGWFAALHHGLSIPRNFWPVFGGIFMFRLIIYMYDLQSMKGKKSLTEFLAYFFILPNYVFLFFPVIDFRTMRMSYYRRDIHETAQQGIYWICRGTIHLLLYMVVFHVRDMLALDGIHSFAAVVTMMFLTFMLYLRVSGQFHIIVGLLHLFGYDLPETNHKYLLSHSLNDFWRRINIYWKDFMVKIVYFPVYFRLRKRNDFWARILATAMVFVVTWMLHSYQTFWLQGQFVMTWQDTIFWGVLGSLVILNVWWEIRHPKRRKDVTWTGRVWNAASVVGTLALILVIWSLWSAPSVKAWVDFLTWWRPGA